MMKQIVTYDGRFQPDQILACGVLQVIYGDLKIVRIKDLKAIQNYIGQKGTIIIGVYDKYDHERLLYDYNQHGFKETFDSAHKTTLSSSGLIFKHYSKKLFETFVEDKTLMKNNKMVDLLIEEIYEEYFEGIDASQNGIDIKSDMSFRSIADIVSDYNCDAEESNNDQTFFSMLEFIKGDLSRYIKGKIRCLTFSEEVLGYMIKNRGKKILYVRNIKMAVPIVRRLEKIYHIGFTFIINRGYKKYTIYALPKEIRGFDLKKTLNEKWLGLRDKELQKVSGISDAIYVHANGFIGEAKTYKSAFQMCENSMY